MRTLTRATPRLPLPVCPVVCVSLNLGKRRNGWPPHDDRGEVKRWTDLYSGIDFYDDVTGDYLNKDLCILSQAAGDEVLQAHAGL